MQVRALDNRFRPGKARHGRRSSASYMMLYIRAAIKWARAINRQNQSHFRGNCFGIAFHNVSAEDRLQVVKSKTGCALMNLYHALVSMGVRGLSE